MTLINRDNLTQEEIDMLVKELLKYIEKIQQNGKDSIYGHE